MKIRLTPWTTVFCLASLATFLTFEAKTMDPYKVLGVEPNASQREIQKAFHKLSLQYHPDKNKSKGAQQKFAEINNAYEILSDEEKRRNYDTYGDEKGNPGFGTGGYSGDQSGYTYFTSGGPGQNQYGSKSGQWQDMGGQGGSKSFSFSFGGPRGSSSFGSGLEDIFSNIFGGHVNSGGGQFGGFGPFGGSSGSQSGSRSSPKNLKSINSQVFMKDIADQGITWILMSYSPSLRGIQRTESVIEEVASSLQGAVKVGAIDCESELSFCKDLGVYPNKAPRVVIYSYKTSDLGSLVDYSGDLVAKNLKSFCQEHLPRFSKRVDLKKFEFSSNIGGRLPSGMLLSSKKDTPVIWRVLSGLYRKRFVFLDAEVNDVSDPIVKKLRVDAVPAIIGWLPDGEKHVLRTGINVKDLKTTIKDLSTLLDGFEKKNKAASSKTKKAPSHSEESHIPLLTASNFDDLCGESTPVCIIGAFKSRKAKEKLQSILSIVSHKTLSRRQILSPGSKDALSYTLLDASKHTSFLNAYDKASFKSSDKILIAYKPRKGKFAVFKGEIGAEEVERFIGSVLNGDIQFMKTRQKPEFR